MGDGHHTWAAAEWIAMVRSCFVREEGTTLILGSGLPESWLSEDKNASFGPIQTRFGTVQVDVKKQEGMCHLSWRAEWRSSPTRIKVAIPGYQQGEFDPIESHTCKMLKTTDVR